MTPTRVDYEVVEWSVFKSLACITNLRTFEMQLSAQSVIECKYSRNARLPGNQHSLVQVQKHPCDVRLEKVSMALAAVVGENRNM